VRLQHQNRRPSFRHAEITVVAVVVGGVLACASKPDDRARGNLTPPPPAAKPPESAPPNHEANVAESIEVVAAKLGVASADFKWNRGRTNFAVAIAPPKGGGSGARYRLAVFGATGQQRADVAAARPGVVEDLRFLGESRLIYRIAPLPPPLDKPAPRPRPSSKKKMPPAPTALYVIQPFAPSAAPLTCEGRSFTFSGAGDHVAWVAGEPGREWVGADGVQVYPRAGVTRIQGEPAWSPDGRSVALIEGGAKPNLVVLVEVDNPHGDNLWPLPPEATDPTLRVFWGGVGRLVVGRELTMPVFSTSFRRQ
jgi:hypothetical protein